MKNKMNWNTESVMKLLYFSFGLITLLYLNVNPLYSIVKNQYQNSILQENKGCQPSLVANEHYIELGGIISGQTVSFPSQHSSGNNNEFILYGSSKKKYDVNISINPESIVPGGGTAAITNYTLEKADYSTSGDYGIPYYNETPNFNSLKLYLPNGAGKCDAFAKFRFTVNEISVSPGAGSGKVNYTVTITVTQNHDENDDDDEDDD